MPDPTRGRRPEQITTAARELLGEGGVPALTSLRIAERLGTSRSVISYHFGRSELRAACAESAAQQRDASIRRRAVTEGVAAFLPGSAAEVAEARAWLACLELARAHLDVAAVVATAAEAEVDLVIQLVGLPLGLLDPTSLHALAIGLTEARCRRVRPMTAAAARVVLLDVVDAFWRTAPTAS